MHGHHSLAAQKLSALPRPGFRSGGLIRGPGTGTSDSIPAEVPAGTYILPKDTTEAAGLAARTLGDVPVALSNGEYEITPKQVQAIGASVLDILRGVTHEPVDQDELDEGAERYANGGEVTRVGNSYSGGNVAGDIQVNGVAPGGTFSQVGTGAAAPATAAPAPAPAALPVASAAPQAPAASAPASAAATLAAVPTPAAPMGWAERNAQRSLEVSASSIKPSAERDAAQAKLASIGRAAAAPAPVAATAPQPVGAAGVLGQVPQPVLSTYRPPSALGQRPGFADGGMVQADERRRALIDQIPAGGLTAPAADGSQDSWTNTEVGRNVSNTLAALPGVAGAGPMLGQAAQALRAVPGIGAANAALGAATGAAGAAGTVGLPATAITASLPSMAEERTASGPASVTAAQALAGSPPGNSAGGPSAAPIPASAVPSSTMQTPSLFGARAVLGSVPDTPGLERANLDMQAPMVRHSGNDWGARKQLENLQTAASSIANQRRWGGQGERSDASQAYQRALANDLSLQGAEGNMAQAAMEQRGANARAQLADVGALDRTLITERGNNARAAITAEGQTLAAVIKARQEAAKEALKANKDNIQQVKDTQDIFSIINEARPVLRGATGSLVGAGLDKVAQGVGYTTDGAKATSQLQVLQGALISKMPKMSGPQSDRDVELYKQMAGQIGDPTTPRAQRMAAMDTIESLNLKYLPEAKDEAGLAQVPSGGWFRAPDGSVRRKP